MGSFPETYNDPNRLAKVGERGQKKKNEGEVEGKKGKRFPANTMIL